MTEETKNKDESSCPHWDWDRCCRCFKWDPCKEKRLRFPGYPTLIADEFRKLLSWIKKIKERLETKIAEIAFRDAFDRVMGKGLNVTIFEINILRHLSKEEIKGLYDWLESYAQDKGSMTAEEFASTYHVERWGVESPMPEYTIRYCDIIEMLKRFSQIQRKAERVRAIERFTKFMHTAPPLPIEMRDYFHGKVLEIIKGKAVE